MTEQGKSLSPAQRLNAYVRHRSWSCHSVQNTSSGAVASIACRTDVPDRLQLTLFRNRRTLDQAYERQLRQAGIPVGQGSCRKGAWRGDTRWSHGIDEPGGRAFCYLSEARQRSYLTWTSEAGSKLLAVAELDSLLHTRLFFWWTNVRHEIL